MTKNTDHINKWLSFCRDNRNLQQFGQQDDESTYNGATGCTHTLWQRLVKASTGKYYSHDDISKIAGYPWPDKNPKMRGMYSGGSDNESGRVVKHFNLPYKLVIDPTWEQIIAALKIGPVMVGIRYGYWPEWEGYHYGSRVADGKPGGFSMKGGKTQLAGAELIYHATLFLGRYRSGKKRIIPANEPNHHSPSRPERPAFDLVKSSQAHRAFNQYGSSGRHTFAWMPTKKFEPEGY
jgi:hypothetical protein